jgi:hypothetical protein
MEDNAMALRNTSRYRVEDVDVNDVDASTLFAIAKHYGFPAIHICYPDGSKYIEIAGTRKAWEHAVRFLEQEGMLKYAYLVLYDWFAELVNDSLTRLSIVSKMFNNCLVLNMANEYFARIINLPMCAYYRVCAMLAHAEARNFPEITIPEYGYTIRGDMESWLNTAKLFFCTPVIVLAIQKLMELDAGGNPLAPTDNTTHSNGGSIPVGIDITNGGVSEWHLR